MTVFILVLVSEKEEIYVITSQFHNCLPLREKVDQKILLQARDLLRH